MIRSLVKERVLLVLQTDSNVRLTNRVAVQSGCAGKTGSSGFSNGFPEHHKD